MAIIRNNPLGLPLTRVLQRVQEALQNTPNQPQRVAA
jgi:hypothetical protein